MKAVDPAVTTQLAKDHIKLRWFLWITVKDLSTGDPQSFGFWNGDSDVSLDVISAETGLAVTRAYEGVGSGMQLRSIRGSANLSAAPTTLRLSPVDDNVELIVRGYNIDQAPVEIHVGFYDDDGVTLAASPLPEFAGFVDRAPITRPKAGGIGRMDIKLQTHSRELSRSNPELRSDESQQRRSAGDGFYKYHSIAQKVTVFWGEHEGAAAE